MSKLPNIVYISSDSSSSDEFCFSGDSDSSGPIWEDYFPQTAPNTRKLEFIMPAEGTSTRAPSLEFYSSSSSSDDDDACYDLSKELPKPLTTTQSTGMSNLNKMQVLFLPCPKLQDTFIKPGMLPKPRNQVLFLPCPKLQATFENKKRGAHKGNHVKGKKPIE